jgi:hypothetical protein
MLRRLTVLLLLMILPVLGITVAAAGDRERACFVYGEIFSSMVQHSALLTSNCEINIERTELVVRMKKAGDRAEFMIPFSPGLHEFVYRWGQDNAALGDMTVPVVRVTSR